MAAKWSRWAILLVYAVIIIVPLVIVLFGAFKSSQDLFTSPLGLPLNPSLANFASLFTTANIGVAFVNSVIVTVVTLLITLFVGSLAAYGVARIPGWRGWTLWGVLVLGMSIPAQTSLVPLYVMFQQMGLTDTLQGLILVETTHAIPITVFILGGFMRTLPRDIYEASEIDGAGTWRTYRAIVLPLSTPSLAAAAIFLFVIVWNDLLYPLMFTSSPAVQTLPIAMLGFQGEFQTNYPAIFAGVIVASAPVVIAYVFLQRYFVAGMTAGATKG
jgi:raffinose/stachyose/melibiose transport system permease protein